MQNLDFVGMIKMCRTAKKRGREKSKKMLRKFYKICETKKSRQNRRRELFKVRLELLKYNP